MNIERIFKIAKELSKKSDHRRYHLGCVLVYKNKIIGKGTNQNKTHPKSNHPYHHLHAEVVAILDAKSKKNDLKGCTCYIYRESVSGKIGMSKPCKYCQQMLKDHGIKEVYYTTHVSYELEKI